MALVRAVVNCRKCQPNVLVMEGVKAAKNLADPDPEDLRARMLRHGWGWSGGPVCPECWGKPGTAGVKKRKA